MRWPEELQFIPNGRAVQHTTTARLDGRLCVVTGATSGVGYSTARRLAQGGAELVLVCRNPSAMERVREELASSYESRVDTVQADLRSLAEVRVAAASILERHERVDVLINNAGVHCTKRSLTSDGNETAFAVNHLASFLLTNLLLPRISASAPSRIIQVNSEGHRFGGLDVEDLSWERRHYTGLRGYGASKIAQLLTVWELADRLAGSGVTINAVHPGGVRSRIGGNNGRLYRLCSKVLVQPFLKDPAVSGEAIYYLAAAPEMATVSGRFFNLTIEEKPTAPALDRALGRRVWQMSRELTGIDKGGPSESNGP